MDQKWISRQMLQVNKSFFDNTFNAVIMAQDQFEKTAYMLLNQAVWIPEPVRTAIDDWVRAYKQGRTDFKKLVDENFEKLEAQFSST